MKRNRILVMLLVVLSSALCALAVTACDNSYNSKHDIPGINANAVLWIERTGLSFARGMEIDQADVIEKCECVLVDPDSGNEVKITKAHLNAGTVSYEKFQLNETGTNKRIKISYKKAENYITYDVVDYKVNMYVDEGRTKLWKTVDASAALNDNLDIAVWLDTEANNYSTDTEVRADDPDGAIAFNGWYTDSDEPATGLYSLAQLTSGLERKLDVHAHYLTQSELAALNLSYDGRGRRVFSGYNGNATELVSVPEGVTYIDFTSIFSSTPNATAINFEKLHIPSTARLDLPLASGINTAGLTEITVDAGNRAYADYNGALYSKDYKTLYLMPASSAQTELHSSLTELASYSCSYWQVKEVTLPSGVNTLQHYCFAFSSNLENVNGRENVASIMKGVFLGTKVGAFSDNGIALYTRLSEEDETPRYSLSMINDTSITEYKVIDGTVSIDGDAFKGCKMLESVDLGNDVEKIGESAFADCTALKSITLPQKLKYLGGSVFSGCTALESVIFPGEVDDITYTADKATYVHTLPSNLFYNCTNLTQVKIPAKITYIGSYAFYKCSSMSEINLPAELMGIGDHAFDGLKITTIAIPSTLTSLGRAAFEGSSLAEIDLSQCVWLKSLSARCFYNTKLTEFTVPSQITEIPERCFYGIKTLKKINLSNVTYIGQYAFSACSGLSEIEWGSSVQHIDSRAFSSCSGLTEVTLPDSVITVNGYAFQTCSNLLKITLGKNVKNFGEYPLAEDGLTFGSDTAAVAPVLYSCNKLREIAVPEENAWFVAIDGALYGSYYGDTNIGKGAVLYAVPAAYEGELFTVSEEVRVILPYSLCNMANVTQVELNEGLENIGKAAFYNSKKLTGLFIPESVTHLGASILLGCTSITEFGISKANRVYGTDDGNLIYNSARTVLITYIGLSENVEIRNGVLEVNDAVFMDNKTVKTVVIPDSVTALGYQTFKGCENLVSIEIGSGLASLDPTAFAELPKLERITVSEDNPNFKAINNVLYSKDGTKLYLCAAKNGLTALDIEKDVTEICDWAFAYHATIASVDMHEGITRIGDYAFYECRNIESINGSQTLKSIGKSAFSFKTPVNTNSGEMRYCDTLKTVFIYCTESIGDNAFYGNYGIENVYLKMTVNELTTFNAGCGRNIAHLLRGCTDGHGTYYNKVKCYLYSATEPTIEYEGYGWFHLVDGVPQAW